MSADPTPLHDPSEEQPPELPRFRYSLQSLFVAVAAFCSLLGGMVAAGPIGGFVLLMGVMAVAAHVFGAVLGKSLRDATSDRLSQKPAKENQTAVVIPKTTETAWQHQPVDQGVAGPAIGAILGAVVGGSILAWLNWQHATIANVSFGAVAFATLGGIGGFAVLAFWKAFRGGWEASMEASETKGSARSDPSGK